MENESYDYRQGYAKGYTMGFWIGAAAAFLSTVALLAMIGLVVSETG